MLGLSAGAMAYDNDPGVGSDRPRAWGDGDRTWYGGYRHGYGGEHLKPIYYRPTQRYYGSGYTVNYRYIPVYRHDSTSGVPVTGAANFPSGGPFRLAPDEIPAWGANAPRLTLKDPKSAAPRTAITSIVPKKGSRTPSKSSREAAPVQVPAIVPDVPASGTAAPVPIPAVPQTPAKP